MKKLLAWLPDVLAVLGMACIVWGAALLHPAAGLIVGGVVLLILALGICKSGISEGGDVD